MTQERPTTIADPFKPLWQWADQICSIVWPGCTCIWQRQTGERPPKPYTSIGVRGMTPVGRMDAGECLDNGVVILLTQVTLTLQIDFFGVGALFAAGNFAATSRRPSLSPAPWSLATVGKVTDISALLDRTFAEERARLDIVFNGGLRDYDDLGYIERIAPGGVLQTSTGVKQCSQCRRTKGSCACRH